MTRFPDIHRLGHLFAEIVNGRDLARFDELVAPGYRNHNAYAAQGLDGVKATFGALLQGMPDMRVSVQDVIVSEDGATLVGRYRYDGTHTGDFMGHRPTGNAVSMRSIDIWRVEKDRFAEHWDEINTLDVFSQVGAVTMRAADAR